jgi:hypothetical protein
MDTALLIIAAFCQGALGFLGLRTGVVELTPNQKRNTRNIFIVITVVGIISVIWSGIRSNEVMSDLADIAAALAPTSKLEVSEVSPVLPTAERGFHFNIRVKNSGSASALGMFHAEMWMPSNTGEASAEDEDKMFATFWQKVGSRGPNPSSSDSIEPGNDKLFFTVPPDPADMIPDDRLEQLLKTSPLYLLVELQWIDQRSKKVWTTESCTYWFLHSAVHRCHGHNRSYVR